MKLKTLIPAFGAYMIASTVQAQETAIAVPTDSVFILNSLLFLIGGFLVFWMAAGFSMLEAGLVRSKNVTMQLTKNMGLFGFACFAYYLVGYNLMYPLGTWATEGVISGIWGPAVLEAVGVHDVLSKSQGSSNPHNVVKATFDALLQLRDVRKVASERGISLEKVYNG